MSAKKRTLQIAVFLLIMFLTFYTLFSGRNLGEIMRAAAEMSPWYLIPAVGLALFYVCAEGFMIWYLLNAIRKTVFSAAFSIPLSASFTPGSLPRQQADSRSSSTI